MAKTDENGLPLEVPEHEKYWLPVTRIKEGGGVATVVPYIQAGYISEELHTHFPGWWPGYDVLFHREDEGGDIAHVVTRCTIHLADGRQVQAIGEARKTRQVTTPGGRVEEVFKNAETDAFKRASRYVLPAVMGLYREDGRYTAEFRPWSTGRGFDMVSAPKYHPPKDWHAEPAAEDDEAEDETTEDVATTNQNTLADEKTSSRTGPRRSGNEVGDRKMEAIHSIEASPFWPKTVADQARVIHVWLPECNVTIKRRSDLMRLSLDELQTLLDKLGERARQDEQSPPPPSEADAPPERGRQAKQASLPTA